MPTGLPFRAIPNCTQSARPGMRCIRVERVSAGSRPRAGTGASAPVRAVGTSRRQEVCKYASKSTPKARAAPPRLWADVVRTSPWSEQVPDRRECSREREEAPKHADKVVAPRHYAECSGCSLSRHYKSHSDDGECDFTVLKAPSVASVNPITPAAVLSALVSSREAVGSSTGCTKSGAMCPSDTAVDRRSPLLCS